MTTIHKEMHASVQKGRGMQKVDWAAFSKNMPLGMDEAAVETRKKFFSVCDINGNGMVSLAEYDRGIRTFIGSGTLSDQLYKAKPAIQRAFHAARRSDVKAGKTEAVASEGGVQGLAYNDYVSRSEFRTLLAYTRQYFELWLMFCAVDTGGANYSRGNSLTSIGDSQGDRRISLAEFTAAVPMLEQWGSTNERSALKMDDPAAEFALIDENGSGYVRFDEFAKWALSRKLDLEDDDDPEGIEALLTAGAYELVTDADAVRRQERREHLEEVAMANAHGSYAAMEARKVLVSQSADDPMPPPLSVKRREMLGAGGGAALTPEKRAEVLRYLGQYDAQYSSRLLVEMRGMLKSAAISRGTPGRLGIDARISRYDCERILSKLEEPSFASLVATPATATAVPAASTLSVPPSPYASVVGSSLSARASLMGASLSARPPATPGNHPNARLERWPNPQSRSNLYSRSNLASRSNAASQAAMVSMLPETRMQNQKRVAANAHRALQASQPARGWGVREGGNPPGRVVPHKWLMSDVMERRAPTAGSGGSASARGASQAAGTDGRWEWSSKLPRAVRPRTVLVDELSRLDPLTVSTSRLRYTPSARLPASEDLISMHFLNPGDKPPMRL